MRRRRPTAGRGWRPSSARTSGERLRCGCAARVVLQRTDRLLGEAERGDRVSLAHEVVAARRGVAALAGARDVHHLGPAAREDPGARRCDGEAEELPAVALGVEAAAAL